MKIKIAILLWCLAWPAPDLGDGWCGTDTDCEMVFGSEPESVLDYPVKEVA